LRDFENISIKLMLAQLQGSTVAKEDVYQLAYDH